MGRHDRGGPPVCRCKDAQVWPMVAAGTSNDEIMAARNIRPLFDNEDQV
ncbi:hypothetical protein AB0K45_10230 [Micrococcus luteus]